MSKLQDNRVTSGSGMLGLITFGFNLTGIDSGELDFSIASARVDDLSDDEHADLMELFERVRTAISREPK